MLPIINLWTEETEIRTWMEDVLECFDRFNSVLPDWEDENSIDMPLINWGGSLSQEMLDHWNIYEDLWILSLPEKLELPESYEMVVKPFELPLFSEVVISATALLALSQGWHIETNIKTEPQKNVSTSSSPSNREKMILQLLSLGESNKSIAYRLSLSESTVKFHINSLFSKLNAQNRTQVVYEALRRGWLYV